ncbi:MAG: hypothetical protein MSC43_02305 [Clostridiales bacterium]|nr:hypothetical protein [Clostridiales bacterium]
MLEKIQAIRNQDSTITAVTWDGTGNIIDLPLNDAEKAALVPIFDKGKKLRPKWEHDVEQAQKVARNALQDKDTALMAKREAEGDKARAEAKAESAMVDKNKAVEAQRVAEAKVVDLQSQIKAANDKIAQWLSGGIVGEAKDELVRQYAEWQPGLSVDAGDAYRVGIVLYIAKQDHITSADNSPSGPHAADYWTGGSIAQNSGDDTNPQTEYKYPAGTVLLWSGVNYRSLKDTNQDPGQAPADWALVSND